jgi:hypothetical protein
MGISLKGTWSRVPLVGEPLQTATSSPIWCVMAPNFKWLPPFILVLKFHFKISIVHFLHKVCYVCSLLQHYIISTNVTKTLGLFKHLRVDIVRLQLNCNDHSSCANLKAYRPVLQKCPPNKFIPYSQRWILWSKLDSIVKKLRTVLEST